MVAAAAVAAPAFTGTLPSWRLGIGHRSGMTRPTLNGEADGVVYIKGKDRVEYAIDTHTGAQSGRST
jgi:hypothetical protein